MKFALVNGIKKIAEPSEVGICICCNSPVRAYCGSERVHHWKHINAVECDSWNEGETEWHRKWKNKFDANHQEIILHDPKSGEKHIADVYLKPIDVVLEFQHSPIHIDEIKARESFYKKMIWIVDVRPYKDNISFHNDIGNAVYDCEHAYMETRFRQISKLSKQGKQKKVEELMDDDEVYAYFENIEKRYFPDYLKKRLRADTASNLLKIFEKEKSKINQNLSGYSLSEEYKNRLKEWVVLHSNLHVSQKQSLKTTRLAPIAGARLQRVPKSLTHTAYQSPQQPTPIIPQIYHNPNPPFFRNLTHYFKFLYYEKIGVFTCVCIWIFGFFTKQNPSQGHTD